MESLTARIAFASLRGMNVSLAQQILSRIDSPERFFELPERQLSAILGFSNRLLGDAYRQDLVKKAEAEAAFVNSHNIHTLWLTDPEFPTRLLDCVDAPILLYATGTTDLNSHRILAIVGTRHATPYGIDFVNHLVAYLASHLAEPVVILSGLAFGIDIAAHKAALQYGLPTVGVLAHGLNTIYPAQHRSVAVEMVGRDGMLLTEYRTSDAIHRGNFVARNRIVAGMCDALVVAESAKKGGAMITAHLASEYGRDVFAVPGRISDAYSAGCNSLIQRKIGGLITSGEDLVSEMGWPTKAQEEAKVQSIFPVYTTDEQEVIDYLTANSQAQINQMAVALNRNIGALMALLIEMEFKHYILKYPGGIYRLA
ncbi:MAG: DNA-processing protein DprA [Bacteroidales bacterium]|nr:DNA-processing protein DprA [Bacteroidales bacterium]